MSSCWPLFCPVTDFHSARTSFARSRCRGIFGGEGSLGVSKCRKMELLIGNTIGLTLGHFIKVCG